MNDNIIKFESDKRWLVTLTYRTESGLVDIEYYVEELEEVAPLVERGTSWDALEHGTFVINPQRAHPLTIEQAETLSVETE